MTSGHDARYIEPFEHMVRAGLLPGFIEIYIQKDINVWLSRKWRPFSRHEDAVRSKRRLALPPMMAFRSLSDSSS